MKLTCLALAASCVLAQTPGQSGGAGETGPAGLTINPGGEYNLSQVGTLAPTNKTYMNPIMTVNAGDPWMTRYDDYYLFTFSTNTNITLKRSKSLTDDWDFAESKVVFTPNPESMLPYSTDVSTCLRHRSRHWDLSFINQLWAPEIHNIDSRWYIIFSATPDADNPLPLLDAMCPFACPAINHRMFVLESSGSDPWESNYTMKAMLNTFDQFAIDGTYFKYNGELYHIYR